MFDKHNFHRKLVEFPLGLFCDILWILHKLSNILMLAYT